MNKRKRSFLSGIVLAGWLISGLPIAAVQMIADRHFQDATTILDPINGSVEGVLQYKDPYGATWWSLGQWDTQGSIYGAVPTLRASGSTQWQNPYKTLVMGPLTSSDGDLILAVDSVAEYGGVYRQPGAPWPNMLIAQNITEPRGWFKNYGPSIDSLHELILDIELNLLQADNTYTTGYNSSIHAAQFLLYFTIQNLNPSSSGYGDFLWFGLRFYDDRDSLPDLFVFPDAGTGKLMYNIGVAPFWTTGLQVGQWKRLVGDLLPHIKLALQEAWNQGFLLDSQSFSDYKIGAMNMGWEVPGLSVVSMQVRNFGLQAYGLDFAKPYEFNIDGESGGWGIANMVDVNLGALNGVWTLTAPGNDPQLNGPQMRLSADRYKQVVVRMSNDGNPIASSIAQLFWRRNWGEGFSESRSVSVTVANDGEWGKYTFDMSSNPEWNGEIVQLRLDPIMSGDGHSVGIDYVRPVVDSIIVGDGFALKGDLSGGVDHVLYWDGAPYQQYTLQQTTNLIDGLWLDVDGFVDVPFSSPLMQWTLSETNRPSSGFYRLRGSPGP